MINRLTESDALKFKTLSAEDKAKRGILGRLYGPVASFANPTRNERHYSQDLWEKLFKSDLIKERFENGGIMGELTHPEDREEIALDRVAIVMPEPPVRDSKGDLIAYVDILDTPAGRIAYQLAKYGYKFGISSRGTGDIIEGIDGDEVDPDTYQLNAFDLVEIPAVKNARLQFVESLDVKKRGKTLKESLQKELDKASDSDKKIMNEALDNLGINLEESKGEYIGLDDVDADKYPNLSDALDANLISLVIYDGVLTNEQFDETGMEDAEIDPLEVKDDIKRFAEHRGLEFQFDYNYSESVKEAAYTKDELIDKFGTDDLDLINAGNEEDVELKEEVDEAFDPSGYTKAIQAINAGIETDEDEEALTDYLSQIIGYCKSIADDYNLYIPALNDEYDESLNETQEGSDIKGGEVVNDQSQELVAEFQEALNKINQLEADNLSLQEKLSVGATKETELKEQLSKYKQAVTKLSETTKKTNTLKKQLSARDAIIADNKQIIEKLSKSELGAKQELAKTNKQLDESKASNKELTDKVNSLNEKLAKSQELVGKYKKSYTALKENYLDIKATSYGLKKDEVKEKLGESYKLSDIDRVCESLKKLNSNLNKLPFKLNENIKIGVVQQTKSESDDDYISSSLINMMN